MSKIAFYIRLSAEDDNRGESNSVSNQRALLFHFIQSEPSLQNTEIVEFCDDGHSGADFDRPAVKDLLEQARRGEIGTILVKDFSRFGRNYADMADYLDIVFPFLQVRFISVNDRYDSNNNKGCTAGIDVGFVSIINNLYIKDLSQKMKSSRRMKNKQGEHLAPSTPFGYKKSEIERNKLAIDEQAAAIVRRIFEMFLSGIGQKEIATTLNAQDIPTPVMYRKINKLPVNAGWNCASERNYWNTNSITVLLKNEVYIGKMIAGKWSAPVIGTKQRIKEPKENWIIVPNAHPAIISESDFQSVQAKLKPRCATSKTPDPPSIFKGKLSCGHCGHALMRRISNNTRYFCRHHSLTGNPKCFEDKILETEIESIILSAINKQAKLFSEIRHSQMKELERANAVRKSTDKKIKALVDSIEAIRSTEASTFEDYANNKITKDEYANLKTKHSKEISDFETKIDALRGSLPQTHQQPPQTVMPFGENFSELTRALIESFIDKILVYGKDRIEIAWNHADEYAGHQSMIDTNAYKGNPTVPKRACVYSRLACPDSELELIQQEKALVEFAKNNNYEVVKQIKEFGNGLIFEREGLQAVLDGVTNKDFEYLVLRDITRIGRDIVKVQSLKDWLDDNGIAIIEMNK